MIAVIDGFGAHQIGISEINPDVVDEIQMHVIPCKEDIIGIVYIQYSRNTRRSDVAVIECGGEMISHPHSDTVIVFGDYIAVIEGDAASVFVVIIYMENVSGKAIDNIIRTYQTVIGCFYFRFFTLISVESKIAEGARSTV